MYPDPNIEKGRHTRGTAVDVSLVKLDITKVKMPTEFDSFEEKAHSNYKNLPKEAIDNRELLKDVMKKHGFNVITFEWWHFDFDNWQEHPPLDL